MQRLSSAEHEYLTDNILKVLAQNRITTLLEFLQEDCEKLSTITKLSLPQLLAIRENIFMKYSAPIVNGRSLLVKNVVCRKYLKTGIDCLDVSTGGGLPTGYITEICGLTDSGKTQLCFQLAINCVKTCEDTVLYIDTKGDFSATRIQKILGSCNYSHKEMANILFKIKVVRLWTMDELIELLKDIKNDNVTFENLSLILIDSLPCLMFQYLSDNHNIGLTFLNIFVNYSRYLCKELNLSIVCVNIQTRWMDQDIMDIKDETNDTSKCKENVEKRNRCLGKYWQHIPALVLILEKSQEVSPTTNNSEFVKKVNVTVMKYNLTSLKQTCSLQISNKGVT